VYVGDAFGLNIIFKGRFVPARAKRTYLAELPIPVRAINDFEQD
jgi:hypothetical protein